MTHILLLESQGKIKLFVGFYKTDTTTTYQLPNASEEFMLTNKRRYEDNCNKNSPAISGQFGLDFKRTFSLL